MKNIGGLEQKVRLVLAALLAVMALESSDKTSLPLLATSLALIFTVWFRFCPIWKTFGFNTNLKRKH